jgi:SAM-dependent methyltransferase
MTGADYPARERYRDPREAAAYDARRFRSWKGRLVDRRERALVDRSLSRARALAGAPGRVERILDLPAGTGRLASFLATAGRTVIAADRSLEMLRQGAGYGGSVQVDATTLPFPDRTFDAVVSLRLLGHLPAAVRRSALIEMRRVSRRFLVVAFYDSTPMTRFRRRLGSRARRGPWHAEPLARTRRELGELGLAERLALPLWRWFSETWVLLLERVEGGAEPAERRR